MSHSHTHTHTRPYVSIKNVTFFFFYRRRSAILYHSTCCDALSIRVIVVEINGELFVKDTRIPCRTAPFVLTPHPPSPRNYLGRAHNNSDRCSITHRTEHHIKLTTPGKTAHTLRSSRHGPPHGCARHAVTHHAGPVHAACKLQTELHSAFDPPPANHDEMGRPTALPTPLAHETQTFVLLSGSVSGQRRKESLWRGSRREV